MTSTSCDKRYAIPFSPSLYKSREGGGASPRRRVSDLQKKFRQEDQRESIPLRSCPVGWASRPSGPAGVSPACLILPRTRFSCCHSEASAAQPKNPDSSAALSLPSG